MLNETEYKKVTPAIVKELADIVGEKYIIYK